MKILEKKKHLSNNCFHFFKKNFFCVSPLTCSVADPDPVGSVSFGKKLESPLLVCASPPSISVCLAPFQRQTKTNSYKQPNGILNSISIFLQKQKSERTILGHPRAGVYFAQESNEIVYYYRRGAVQKNTFLADMPVKAWGGG